jgi:hypothetical protein
MSISERLNAAERLLEPEENGVRPTPIEVRGSVVAVLLELYGQDVKVPTPKLSDLIDAIGKDTKSRRAAALFLTRCLSVPGVIPDENQEDERHTRRKLVALVEQSMPDICVYLKLGDLKQTIDKLDVLRDTHRRCTEILDLFRRLPSDPDDFCNRRQDILHALGNKFMKAYLSNYEFDRFSNSVRNIANDIVILKEITDATFGVKLQHVIDEVNSELSNTDIRNDFLAKQFYLPFLRTASSVLVQIDKQSSDRFKCFLHPRRPIPNVSERRFQLHKPNEVIRVNIPIVYDGPGVATDVTALIVSNNDQVVVSGEPIDIGTVLPGEFALNFGILLDKPCGEVRLLADISWRTSRDSERQTTIFDAVLYAQDPNVDWEELESKDPYSIEVAHGDEFVGRRRKVMTLVNRIRKQNMQSSYITGQKRVGKTSLAVAVQDQLTRHADNEPEIEVIYLEYGDYARKDADATVEALGSSIAERLLFAAPLEDRPENLNFSGSLAPLS